MSTEAELDKRTSEKIIKLGELLKSYTEKLRRIGEGFGFNTRQIKTERGRTIDRIWRLENAKVKELNGLPIAIFEVICYEDPMILRDQCLDILAGKPALAVFVLVKERMITSGGIMPHRKRSKKTIPEQWLQVITKLIRELQTPALNSPRIIVWTDKEVDKLYLEMLSK